MPRYTFVSRAPVDKGWSGDRKFRAEDAEGTKYLLRVSPAERRDARLANFELMRQCAALDIPMCLPLDFYESEEGVCSVQSWIDGTDAEDTIPLLPEERQYAYGLDAGRALSRIHSIPAPADAEDWEIRFGRKMDYKILRYTECPIHYENGQAFIDCIAANRSLLKGRPQSMQHGDFHIGNMMTGRDGRLYIIDFDRTDHGDPWEEFNRVVWCAQKSPAFASGMVDGYFSGSVPDEFWRLLALYISSNMLSSVYWAIPFGQDEVDVMIRQAREVLEWYDLMRDPVPSWYGKPPSA